MSFNVTSLGVDVSVYALVSVCEFVCACACVWPCECVRMFMDYMYTFCIVPNLLLDISCLLYGLTAYFICTQYAVNSLSATLCKPSFLSASFPRKTLKSSNYFIFPQFELLYMKCFGSWTDIHISDAEGAGLHKAMQPNGTQIQAGTTKRVPQMPALEWTETYAPELGWRPRDPYSRNV